MLARYVHIKIPRVSRRVGLSWYYLWCFLYRITKNPKFKMEIHRGVHPGEGYEMDYLYLPTPWSHIDHGLFKAFFKKGHYAKPEQQTY